MNITQWNEGTHKEYNHIRNRKVEPSRSHTREDEDSDVITVVMELFYQLVSLWYGCLAIDGDTLDTIKA